MSSGLKEGNYAQQLLRVNMLRQRGENSECIKALRSLATACSDEQHQLLQEIGLHFTSLELHHEAEACYARSLKIQADNPSYIYNHSTSLIALGNLLEAEKSLEQVINLAPNDADAWYNLATLRKQTKKHNHVALIKQQLAKSPQPASIQIALNYALAKELEDLNEHRQSFAALKRGADLRRSGLAYNVNDDLETIQLIKTIFDADFFSKKQTGHNDARPLFIVGLPRSGSTLIDRILSSHSDVISRGENTNFALSMMQTVGPASNKSELVKRSANLDFNSLGSRYCTYLQKNISLLQIDKTPSNFLYLGLIAKALPNAHIVHIRRNPMDACYAIYKTLFRMGYPYSYDLNDLGKYWLSYNSLMQHWQNVLPTQQFSEIDYEDLVQNQESVSRKVVSDIGLQWEDSCLAFEHNPEPSLTASAAQIRQPIYQTSVQLWKRYEQELSPLREFFHASGINTENTSGQNE